MAKQTEGNRPSRGWGRGRGRGRKRGGGGRGRGGSSGRSRRARGHCTASDKGGGNGIMDDVMAQLERQRAKAAAESSTATMQTKISAVKRKLGGYGYDTVSKAYFPISMGYDPHGVLPAGHAAGQMSGRRLRGETVVCSSACDRADVARPFPVSPQRAAVGISRLPSLSLSVALLDQARTIPAYHVISETMACPKRRHAVRSEMASAMLCRGGGEGVRLVPTVRRCAVHPSAPAEHGQNAVLELNSSTRTYRAERKRATWRSMLLPIGGSVRQTEERLIKSGYLVPQPSHVPSDCACKQDLHPSARTFDVKESKDPDCMPHIATIIGRRGCDQIWYRNGTVPEGGESYRLPSAPFTIGEDESRRGEQYQSVKFAPFWGEGEGEGESLDKAIMGAVSNDGRNGSGFSLLACKDNVNGLAEPILDVAVGGALRANDFAFSPGAKFHRPGVVAFAHTTSRKSLDLYFLDVASSFSYPRHFVGSKVCVSETLCVHRLDELLFYGHRNGKVSILDNRTNTLSSTEQDGKSPFGSTIMIKSLADCGNPYSFVAKDGFGPCRLYDMRRLSTGDGGANRKGYASSPALVRVMTRPIDDMYVTGESRKMQGSGGNGIAVDPSGNTLLSPCISSSNRNGGGAAFCIGAWSLVTGRMVREIELVPNLFQELWATCNAKDDDLNITGSTFSKFCELSSTATSGWDFKKIESPTETLNSEEAISRRVGSMGLWFKFQSGLQQMPREGGGIHHLSFPTLKS